MVVVFGVDSLFLLMEKQQTSNPRLDKKGRFKPQMRRIIDGSLSLKCKTLLLKFLSLHLPFSTSLLVPVANQNKYTFQKETKINTKYQSK
jgi:hypothetical protein